MAVPHNRTISGDDKIFGINKLAVEMAAKVGAENVINATIGALLDDEGKLMVLPSVIETYKKLEPDEMAAYAPISGVPSFLEKVKIAAFGKYMPEAYIEAVATPGGTGAIRNTVQNYSSIGDTVLTSDWYWSPYKTISDEIGRKIETYTMFNESRAFNLEAFESKVNELLERQTHLVIILNAPSHNPTGYTLTSDEWDGLIHILRKSAQNQDKKITLFLDIAYIDFAGHQDESRQFFQKFSGLPDNLFIIAGFSMSKSYTLYGMRCGAMICITQSQAIAEEFKVVNMYSCRGTWSNGTRPAMMILNKIFEDKMLHAKVSAQRANFMDILESRGRAFLKAAKEASLETFPFESGFFITIPCNNAEEVGKELQKDGIFAVPIGAGIRFALSAVSEEKCSMVPAKMAAAIEKFK
jgi:aromatic-amino-acid transaminase